MIYLRTGLNRNVYYTVFSYRIMLPYGKSLSKSSYFVLLNYDKKILINTGVIESQSDLETLFQSARISYKDVDYIINMSAAPEHIGLNSVIQYQNKKALFYSNAEEIPYIEDTVRQHEERYVPGFYKLVSGNTENVKVLQDGQKFDLGDEELIVQLPKKNNKEKFKLYLKESNIEIYPNEVCLAQGDSGKEIELLKAV